MSAHYTRSQPATRPKGRVLLPVTPLRICDALLLAATCVVCVRACMARERASVCERVKRERERERESVCIVFEANEILVFAAYDDKVPRCHPTQDTLS